MIIAKADIGKLNGHFIIELNDSDEEEFELNEKNWSFYKEKRISFVVGLSLNGFYYSHGNYKTDEEFVEKFNPCGGRFRRLLTSKEIDFLCKKLKEENY